MDSQTIQSKLLDSLESAFQRGQYKVVRYIVKAIRANASVTEREQVMAEINKLPSANPVRGFFEIETCDEAVHLSFGEDTGLKTIFPKHDSNEQVKLTGAADLGIGPRILECRLGYDTTCRSVEVYDAWGDRTGDIHIRTIFYHKGDDRHIEGLYFRVFNPRLKHQNFMIGPGGIYLDPSLIPVASLMGWKLKKFDDESNKHTGLYESFLIALNKDLLT